MELNGTIHNGIIVLDDGASLPEGTRVKVEEQSPPNLPSHFDLFREIIGGAADLPRDMALNHDHYTRGSPKK